MSGNLSSQRAREMGKKKTKVKALAAAKNGEKGGRPRTRDDAQNATKGRSR